jgi:hypothetical protein
MSPDKQRPVSSILGKEETGGLRQKGRSERFREGFHWPLFALNLEEGDHKPGNASGTLELETISADSQQGDMTSILQPQDRISANIHESQTGFDLTAPRGDTSHNFSLYSGDPAEPTCPQTSDSQRSDMRSPVGFV